MKEENTVSSAEMKEIERIADGNGPYLSADDGKCRNRSV